jgi:hypothetical protein
MKRRLILVSAILVAWISNNSRIVPAQSSSSSSNVASKEAKIKKVRLYPMGYFYLPEGYQAYRTQDLHDAFFGYIISPDKKFRINWSFGIVKKPFEEGENKFIWVKSENISKGVLKYGLKRTDNKDAIVATVGLVNLFMSVKTESDVDLFLSIARSYKDEKCDDCELALPEPMDTHS